MRDSSLHYGDCLEVLRNNVPDGTADLIYVDPPAPVATDYNSLFVAEERQSGNIKAAWDTWVGRAGPEPDDLGRLDDGLVQMALSSLRSILGPSLVVEFLTYLAPRMLEMRRVMSRTSSILVHTDPSFSPYVRLLLDALFGPDNFRGEIVWTYSRIAKSERGLVRSHDTLLYYTKSDRFRFDASALEVYGTEGNTPPQKRVIRVGDVWELPLVSPASSERVGYATQRPISLLTRLVRMTTRPGDLVLDPFAGSGTALIAANQNGRRWVGIDVSALAIGVARRRMDLVAPGTYEILGQPRTIDEARSVARRSHFEFETWALGLVGAEPTASPKTRNRAADGVIHFRDGREPRAKTVFVEVKASRSTVATLRPLEEALAEGSADLAVLIVLDSPTPALRHRAERAGSYFSESSGGPYPRLQVIGIGDLLAGEHVPLPASAGNAASHVSERRPDSQPGS